MFNHFLKHFCFWLSCGARPWNLVFSEEGLRCSTKRRERPEHPWLWAGNTLVGLHVSSGAPLLGARQCSELKFKEKLGFTSEAEHVQQEPLSQQQLPANTLLLL